MRIICGLVLVVLGVLAFVRPWLPLPDSIPTAWASGGLIIVGSLMLVGRRRSGTSAPVDAILAAVKQRGFEVVDEAHGWRSRGTWDGRPVEIRHVRGYEASRFGLESVVEVTIRGRPTDPWPLMPDVARIVDQREHAVSIALPACSRIDGAHRLGRDVAAVLALVEPDVAVTV